MPWTIVVHGGAGSDQDEVESPERMAVLRAAVAAGRQCLCVGGSALDAVQLAVERMEDSPLFNAGRGSAFHALGGHEMDAAIMSGDRSGMGQDTLRNLRSSNLAHLLAISGLHMGLLTAFVFAVVRCGLVLIPGVGLRWPVKRIAAVAALAAGAFYLALSGGNVATERAFIMVAVMFVAVLLGRRALTLRAVAMAAIIVLILHPNALMGPGFQMGILSYKVIRYDAIQEYFMSFFFTLDWTSQKLGLHLCPRCNRFR